MKNSTKTHLSFLDLETRATVTLVPYNAFAFFLAILLFLSACNSDLSDFDNQQVNEILGDSLFTVTESWGINMEVLEDGKVRLRLSGSYAASINMDQQEITKISGPVYIEIFDEEGEISTIVDADSAVHHPISAEFEMFGDVRVQAAEGKRLYSDYLKWERSADKVSTPEFVEFISPPDSIAAKGFFGNSDLTNYTLNEGGGRAIID